MWKSLVDSMVEAFAMCDPVAYMHYRECKRLTERQAVLTPHCESGDRGFDQWVAFSERTGWHDYENMGARRHRNETRA